MKRRPKLVTPWRQSFRFWTQRLNAFAVVSIPAWFAMPEEDRKGMLASIGLDSPALFIWLMFGLSFVLRNIQQSQGDDKPPNR